MQRFRRIALEAVLISVLALNLSAVAEAGSPTLTTLYTFAGPPTDGSNPYAGVTIGPKGVLYGTTLWGGAGACDNCGTAFSLTPPAIAGGVWTESVYTLPDVGGVRPYAGLTLGPGGVLYGNAFYGGVCNAGAAFQLKPPASPGGAWAERDLYSWCGGGPGAYPQASVVIGAGGVLYGTALDESGTVYSLAPPATEGGDWSYSVLDASIGCGPSEDAIGPCTGVAIGSGGVLYGTVYWGGTTGGGMVYSLAPPASSGGSWTQTFLYSFPYLPNGGSDGYRPDTPVVIGAGGVL